MSMIDKKVEVYDGTRYKILDKIYYSNGDRYLVQNIKTGEVVMIYPYSVTKILNLENGEEKS